MASEVRPGDKLVIGVSEIDNYEEWAAQLRAQLPGVEVVVIENLTAMAVYRPGNTEGGK